MTWVDTLDSYAVQGPGRTFHLLVKEIVIGRGGAVVLGGALLGPLRRPFPLRNVTAKSGNN